MTPEHSTENGRGSGLRNKLAILGLSGVLFTGAAVGLAGVASAQDSGPVLNDSTPVESVTEGDDDGFDAQYLGDFELSPEDEALFEQYDQCLVDNGLDIESIEATFDDEELTDEQIAELDKQWEAIEDDAEKAFAACDPILEDLSDEFQEFDAAWDAEFGDEDWTEAELIEDLDLSAEDEAVLERFDQCLVDGGIDELDAEIDGSEELTDEQWEAIEAGIDEVFENCEPILEDLSEDAEFLFEDCPDDEANEYDEAEELELAPSGADA